VWDWNIEFIEFDIILIEAFLISYVIWLYFVGMGKRIHSLSYTTHQLIRLLCASWLNIGQSKMPICFIPSLFFFVCSCSFIKELLLFDTV
jgi:hypothetical protein